MLTLSPKSTRTIKISLFRVLSELYPNRLAGIENCDTEQSAFWEDDLPDGSTNAQYGPEVCYHPLGPILPKFCFFVTVYLGNPGFLCAGRRNCGKKC